MKRIVILILVVLLAGCSSGSSATFKVFYANEGGSLGKLTWLAIDKEDNVFFVGHDGTQLIRSGARGAQSVVYNLPADSEKSLKINDVSISKDNNIFILDSKGYLTAIDISGNVKNKWLVDASDDKCYAIENDREGNVYITNNTKQSIYKYTKDGELLTKYKVGYPMGIAITSSGIVLFGQPSEGSGLWSIDKNGIYNVQYRNYQPTRIYVDNNSGYIYLYSTGQKGSLNILDKDFKLLESWQDTDYKVFPSKTNGIINDVIVNSKGVVYTTKNNQILQYDRNYQDSSNTLLIWVGIGGLLIAGIIRYFVIKHKRYKKYDKGY